MIATALRYEADIVGGPVFPVFEDPDHWLARGGLYAPRRFVTGRVEMIYGAGTMLIRRDVLAHYLDEPFSDAFAFTGGSDHEFFIRCRRDGCSFAWADDARLFETTPRARTTPGWLLLRSFRKGTVATRIDRRYSPGRASAALGRRHRPDRLRAARGAGRRMAGPHFDHGEAARRCQGRRAPRGGIRHRLI
jgi:hypothetical protein